MNRRRLANLLLCSLIALAPVCTIADGVSESDRRWILANLAGDFASSQLRDAAVFKAGDLAAVRLAGISRAVVVLERSVDGDGAWNVMAKITAVGEQHFGDAVLISPSTLLIAAPDIAGAGLGPGATYVFQRNVGGKNHWGLVAKLAPADYPAPGLIAVEQLSEPSQIAAVTSTPGVVPLPPVAEDAPEPQPRADAATLASMPPPAPSPVQAATPEPEPLPPPTPPPPVLAGATEPEPLPPPTPPPVQAATPEPVSLPSPPPPVVPPPPVTAPAAAAATSTSAGTGRTTGEKVNDESSPRARVIAEPPEGWGEPAPADDNLRYIAVASMRELPHALAFSTTLKECGYPSEVHRNQRGFYVVTLARLPLADAKEQRVQAIAAGDIPREAYLIVGSSFREKISP